MFLLFFILQNPDKSCLFFESCFITQLQDTILDGIVSLPLHKLVRPPCCYYCIAEASDGITFVPHFVKSGQLVQTLKGDKPTHKKRIRLKVVNTPIFHCHWLRLLFYKNWLYKPATISVSRQKKQTENFKGRIWFISTIGSDNETWK
jgi:hypothetical protein